MRIILLLLISCSLMGQKAAPSPANKTIYFQGNSLFDTNVNHTINNLKYVTLGIYNALTPSYPKLTFQDYSISGQDQVQINAVMTTQFKSGWIKAHDVVVIWEGTNNLAHYDLKTGAQAFAELQTWVNHVSQFTDKWIVCTVIPRDAASDAEDLMDRIDDYNTLVRANYTGNHLCDIAAHSFFNQRTDVNSSPPYDTDKLHLFQLGQDTVIQVVKRAIIKVL